VTFSRNKIIEKSAEDAITQHWRIQSTGRGMCVAAYYDTFFGTFAFRELPGCMGVSKINLELPNFVRPAEFKSGEASDQALPVELAEHLKAFGASLKPGSISFEAAPPDKYDVANEFVKGLPPGLQFDPAQGKLAGTATESIGKTFQALFYVRNAQGEKAAELWVTVQVIVTPLLEGAIDLVNCQTVSGWAKDRNNPQSIVKVDIFDGNRLLATVPANQLWKDPLSVDPGGGNQLPGRGGNYHGFSYPLPESVKDGRPHVISVRFAGTGTSLAGSPKTITCQRPNAVLTTQAICEGCATASVQVAVPIAVATAERDFTQTTAFNFENPIGGRFSLQAPTSVTVSGKTLQFKHWLSVTDQQVLKTTPLLSGFSDKTETFAAVYQVQAANGALNIVSICEGCVTGPVQFSGATVTVSNPALGDRPTPFNFNVALGGQASLTAAATASAGGKSLQFKHWFSITDNRVITTNRTLSGTADKTETLAAVYQVAQAPLATLRVETRLGNGNALTNVPILVIAPCQVQGGCRPSANPDGSFQLTLNAGATAQLRAPKYSNGSEQCNLTVCPPRFARWRVGAQTLTTEQTVTITVNQNTTVVAEYQ
jgi:hypothetical protein